MYTVSYLFFLRFPRRDKAYVSYLFFSFFFPLLGWTTGAALADVALLVIDAPSFEVGLRGQTKEHLLIVRCLGIQHFVVALNKMDEVGWSKETYDMIVTRLRDFMTGPEIGCSASRITFAPVSAFTGVNVVRSEVDEDMSLGCIKDGKKEGMDLRGKKSVGKGRGQHSKDRKGKEEEIVEKTVEREHLKTLKTWWTGPSLLEALEDVEVRRRIVSPQRKE